MRRSPLAVILVALVLSACGSDRHSGGPRADSPPATNAPAPAPAATGAPNAGAPSSLQFTAPLVGGGSLDFTQFAGQTVALWFWAPT